MSRPGPSSEYLLYLAMPGAKWFNSQATASACGRKFLLMTPPDMTLAGLMNLNMESLMKYAHGVSGGLFLSSYKFGRAKCSR